MIRVKRLFVLSFDDADDWESHKQYYLPTVEIKDHNVLIDGRNLFDQTIKNDLKTNDSIRKIATGKGNDYTPGCLLDYPYFKKYYRLIAIDLSKQQKLDADPTSTQQVNFTRNLDKAECSPIFFIIVKSKEKVLEFSKGTVKVDDLVLF